MQLPCIHMNGDRKETLIDALCAASEALDAAYDKLRKTAPNGRNFYPLGPTAMRKAEEEHMDRLRRIHAVKDEIDALTIAIDAL